MKTGETVETGKTGIRVLLADDHALFRQGVRRLLEQAGDIEVVGEAGSGEQTVQLVEHLVPDIVLLDVAMPTVSGIDAARMIKASSPRAGIIMLTVHDDHDKIFEAICAGASGYLLKNSSRQTITTAIQDVLSGGAAMHAA